MLVEAKQEQLILSDGQFGPLRQCRQADVALSDSHALYFDAVSRGNCYTGGMAAAAAMGTALTLTMVTICLYNPYGSGVNLVLLNINGQGSALGAGGGAQNMQDVLACNIVQNQAAPTTTTLIAHTNCLLGGIAGKGKLFSVATLPAAPTFLMGLMMGYTPAGVGGIDTKLPTDINLGGRVILTSNTSVCIQGVGTAHNAIWSMTWEEVPI